MPAGVPPDQYTQVGGVSTRFWAVGDKGATVVLLHGLGGHVEDWQQNIGVLGQRHRVYAVDLVGCGRSGKPPVGYSLSFLTRFVSEFLETLQIDRASLIGHSLGGALALQLAAQLPDKIEKLILVSCAGLGKEVMRNLRLSALPVLGEWLTSPRPWGIARFLKKSVYDPDLVTADLVETCYGLAALPGAREALLTTTRAVVDIRGMRDQVVRSTLESLARLTTPTLIVWGQQDRTLPVAHAYIAGERIQGAQVCILQACGHFPQWEHAEEFNSLALAFLAT